MKGKAQVCPCGSAAPLARCCGAWHAGEAAPTPEALMRSRYSAYVLGLEDYLRATWHRSTRPASVLAEDALQIKWIRLKIVACTQPDAEHGTVEFVATYRAGGRAEHMHELSRFVREDGRWYYVDGDVS